MASTGSAGHPGNCCCATVLRCVWPPSEPACRKLVFQSRSKAAAACCELRRRPAGAAAAAHPGVGLWAFSLLRVAACAGTGAQLRGPAASTTGRRRSIPLNQAEHRENKTGALSSCWCEACCQLRQSLLVDIPGVDPSGRPGRLVTPPRETGAGC